MRFYVVADQEEKATSIEETQNWNLGIETLTKWK